MKEGMLKSEAVSWDLNDRELREWTETEDTKLMKLENKTECFPLESRDRKHNQNCDIAGIDKQKDTLAEHDKRDQSETSNNPPTNKKCGSKRRKQSKFEQSIKVLCQEAPVWGKIKNLCT